jgi:3-hydroxy-9,10-secoandrosta-1,3,5(10)-triene-9,17-dione monooxygenase reductase component
MMATGDNPFAPSVEERDPARRLRGRLVAPVTLWTAGAADAAVGLTVSSLLVAEGPRPGVLGLISPNSDLWDTLQETRAFVLHVLEERHRGLAQRFAGLVPSPGGPFAGEALSQSPFGPVMLDVPTRALCRVDELSEIGYARLVRAAIDDVTVGGDVEPLAYLRGRFRRLEARRG